MKVRVRERDKVAPFHTVTHTQTSHMHVHKCGYTVFGDTKVTKVTPAQAFARRKSEV